MGVLRVGEVIVKRDEFNYLLIPWATMTAGLTWALEFWGLIIGAVLVAVAWLFLDHDREV